MKIVSDERLYTITLFLVFMLVFPVPIYMAVCAGIVPAAVVAITLLGLSINYFSEWNTVGFVIGLCGGVLVLAVTYWCSSWVIRKVFASGFRHKKTILGLLFLACLAISMNPFYSFDCMDGSSYMPCSAPDVYMSFFGRRHGRGDFG